MARKAEVSRKTKETEIIIKVNIDGTGENKISTGIGFLDHMLELFAFHGLFDLDIQAKGDLKVDIHHTNEDIGISLGQAFKKALGDCIGIRRFGSKEVPMDLASAKVTVDIGGRYAFLWKSPVASDVRWGPTTTAMEQASREEGYSLLDGKDFLDTFAKNANINLHVESSGLARDVHHELEAVFKAFGAALDEATQIDIRRKGVPSTKGIL